MEGNMRLVRTLVFNLLLMEIIASAIIMVGGLVLLILAGTKNIPPEMYGWNALHFGTGISYIGLIGLVAGMYLADTRGVLKTLHE